MTKTHIPGLKLSELFYQQAVLPLLEEVTPGLRHSAGLIDAGSEVFGFDTERSSDHHWGPRVLLFLSDSDVEQHAAAITEYLANHLSYEFMGYPTHFGKPDGDGVRLLELIDSGPVAHRAEIHTVGAFFTDMLDGCDPRGELTQRQWVELPMQKLYGFRKGRLFRDDLGMEEIRRKLHFYPRDAWLYVMNRQWARVEEEQAFVGRCGELGDELGSHLIGCRIVDALMKITFLLEGDYFPYSKWTGTAFKRLATYAALNPHFEGVLAARDWHTRERHLSEAYRTVLELHNRTDGAPHVEIDISRYFGRPFIVPHAERIMKALTDAIEDKTIL